MKKVMLKTYYLAFVGLLVQMSGVAVADVPNTFSAGDTIRASEMNANFSAMDARISALEAHVADTSNPHDVTKSQVGLGNLENTRVRFSETTSPTVMDDSNAGFVVGTLWVNTSTTQAYVLTDATNGAAVWKEFSRTYVVGDTGPAGGIVFFVTDDGAHGLEAAPNDQSSGAPWCSTFDDIAEAEGTNQGDGSANTAAILEGCSGGTNGIAAQLAEDYVLNGFGNWYLPPQDELNLMYTALHLNGLGNFIGLPYWTSSQTAFDTAQARHFGNGNQGATDKGASFRVRVVRAF